MNWWDIRGPWPFVFLAGGIVGILVGLFFAHSPYTCHF